MRNLIAAAIIAPLLSFTAMAGYIHITEPLETQRLVQKVHPGVVLITNQIDVSSGGTGTGFILEDNVIVTNHHVVDKNGKLGVYFANNPIKYEAEIVYADIISDIAVIRLKDWEKFKADNNFVNLELGDSDKSVLGSKVVVIGHPWGLSWTVSEGIVSAKHRRAGPNPKYIDQIDAKLFQGNSGGPVFNQNGKVVCVSNMMLTGEGGSYGFCVPSNLVKKVLNDFKVLGEVRWRVFNITLGVDDKTGGLLVNLVETGGAADLAGVKANDKILEIYTTNFPEGVKVKQPDDIITVLATMNGNDEKATILIQRDGEEMSLDIKTNFKLSKDYEPPKAN
jgi:S1-C subfamily serine protease